MRKFGAGEISSTLFADAQEEMQRLRQKPFIRSVWCVDRPDFYRLIRELTNQIGNGLGHSILIEGGHAPLHARTVPLTLPVFLFSPGTFHPKKDVRAQPSDDLAQLRRAHPGKTVWPWWCFIPGVHAEMSDGTIRNLETGQPTLRPPEQIVQDD